MHATSRRHRPFAGLRLALLVGATALLAGGRAAWAQGKPPATTQTAAPAKAPADQKLPPEQLQSLVAPIALYPDDLLAQTLVASTYPLEIVQLQQWLAKNPKLKDKALADSVAKQPWDPAIQSMAAVPEVVKRLADDIQWTTDLGNAFLAQQAEVMDAVQVMRQKAQKNGALESNQQQKVETKVVEQKQVIVVEPASPEVIYVPSYSPTVVYGAPVYPYPPIAYPYYPPGAAFVSFSFGMMWGAAMWGGSCCHAGWGGNNIYINNNNNFNRVSHYQGGNRNVNRGGGRGNNWQHNPQHRGGAPYADQRTADRFGGSTRGAGVSDRSARTGTGQRGAGVSDRAAGTGQRGTGVSDRAAGAGQGQRGAGASDRGAGVGTMDRGAAGGTGSDRIGSRDIPSDASARTGGADRSGGFGSADRGGGGGVGSSNRGGSFGGSSSGSSWGGGGFSGGSRGFDGASARASGSRGASSMGGRGGGGARGGGRRR